MSDLWKAAQRMGADAHSDTVRAAVALAEDDMETFVILYGRLYAASVEAGGLADALTMPELLEATRGRAGDGPLLAALCLAADVLSQSTYGTANQRLQLLTREQSGGEL